MTISNVKKLQILYDNCLKIFGLVEDLYIFVSKWGVSNGQFLRVYVSHYRWCR
jgi:hypothetical protein